MSWNRRLTGAVVALVVLSGCSSSDAPVPVAGSGPSGSASVSITASSSTVSEPPLTSAGEAAGEPAITSSVPSPAGPESTVAVVESTAPVPVPVSDPPQTGVPGTEADVICRGVGTLVVSEYLIGLIEAFGDEPGARRAEAAAAPAVLEAFSAVDGALAAAGIGQESFTRRWDGLLGRVRSALAAADLAGVGLGARWLELIATHDRNDPVVTLDLDPIQTDAVDRAATAISAEHGPIVSDDDYLDSVVVATPELDAHLGQRCPEVALLGAGDAV